MIDPISITALIIGILAGLSRFINESHIQRLKCCFCIDSDCRQRNKSKSSITPPNTPTDEYINKIHVPTETSI